MTLSQDQARELLDALVDDFINGVLEVVDDVDKSIGYAYTNRGGELPLDPDEPGYEFAMGGTRYKLMSGHREIGGAAQAGFRPRPTGEPARIEFSAGWRIVPDVYTGRQLARIPFRVPLRRRLEAKATYFGRRWR